jgi:hypothetical protein
VLKGRDLLIARAAHQAGLRVYVQPTFTKNRDVRMYLKTFLETGYGTGGMVVKFDSTEVETDEEDEDVQDLIPTCNFAGTEPHDRIRCGDDGGKFLLFETR